MSGKKKQVAIYTRVNSSDQEVATQAEACTRLAVSLGFQVDAECVHREIGSGGTLDRAQLANLRRMASAGKLDALIVCSVERLSRKPVDLLALLREFSEHGVEVHFVQGSADSTSVRNLLEVLLENPELRELRCVLRLLAYCGSWREDLVEHVLHGGGLLREHLDSS